MASQAFNSLALSDSVFVILRDLIHERTGLYYSDDKRESLADRLSKRLAERQFGSFLDYYYHLRYDQSADQEWRHVSDALGVQETYFWREFDQIQALVDLIVPEYFATSPDEPLRIWSAACATGEEPLTIALALEEAGWWERAPIEIWASDASPAAIAVARRGVYRERSFRSLPQRLRERYFTETAAGAQIDPEIHSRVKWKEANLMDREQVSFFATAPVIFCRNAFIYFSSESTQQTLRLFAESMPTPAYLFVGVSESLLKLTADFELQQLNQAFAYVKTQPYRAI